MSNLFSCWPGLEAYAKRLTSRRFANLFYYDYEPTARTGKPIVILIHGLGDEADTWRHIIPLLGKAGCRVLAPDLPGFGRSDANKHSRMKDHRDAVLELMQTVSGNSPQEFVLAGSSMGAAVAEAAALKIFSKNKSSKKMPSIKALVLLDGCIPADFSGSSSLLLMALPFVGKKWYCSLRKDPERSWQSLYSYYADIQSLPEADKEFLRTRVMDRVTSSSQKCSYFSTLRSMIFQRLRSSYYRRIGSWPGKIALVWGEKDTVVPIAQAESFVKLRNGTQTELSVIQYAGHLPHQEKPEETSKVILAFITAL